MLNCGLLGLWWMLKSIFTFELLFIRKMSNKNYSITSYCAVSLFLVNKCTNI